MDYKDIQSNFVKEQVELIKSRPIRMAICYDFDKTLSPDDMQAFTLIPSFGIDKSEFWHQSNSMAKDNLMDNNLAWMYQLIKYSKFQNKSIKRGYFNEIGCSIPLYNGVDTWFDRVNKYAESKGISIEHYIISSGLKEIIEGSKIADKITRIYASSYYYSTDGTAEWPAQAINYTNKTQFIFRIAKGIFEEYDESVNSSMKEYELYIPYENIVYIGDSATDIPCMRLVKSKGGYSIGVYDPKSDKREKVYSLFNDNRIDFYAPANYSARSMLSKYIKQIIDTVAAKEQMKTEQKLLNINAGLLYKTVKLLDTTIEYSKDSLPKKDVNRMVHELEELKKIIPGNI